MKNFLIYTLFLISFSQFTLADNTYFVDYTKILNQSKAGSDAQKKLKSQFENENNKFSKIEEDLKNIENEIISQKKLLSSEEYKTKVEELRKKVAKLQNDKQNVLGEIAKTRALAKQELLKNINPILKKYMEENQIRLVVDKQSVILGDSSLEITDKIIEILDKKLVSIKIN